ncbi:hypothetical protein J2785_001475 [Burkholderia ambifaria]|nr:hypothetical protein [Burkholderia ambifaria]MDR6498331.1 hypothetical protein [Burkholderia ambifaria]
MTIHVMGFIGILLFSFAGILSSAVRRNDARLRSGYLISNTIEQAWKAASVRLPVMIDSVARIDANAAFGGPPRPDSNDDTSSIAGLSATAG